VAVSFALVLNLALASSLVWTDLLPPMVRTATWLLAAVMWTASVISSYRWLGASCMHDTDAAADVAYVSGVEQYLRANWFEAEAAFNRLIERDSRDIEARLMLATLCRHTGRPNEARAHLTGLQRLAGAEKWQQEIHRELGLLAADGLRPAAAQDGQQSRDELADAA
jgi:thioredoxin-like negative regulator of GroEL